MSEDNTEIELNELQLRIAEEFQEIPGVGPAVAEKLVIGGYQSVDDIAVTSPGQLMDKCGMTKTTAAKVIAGARAKSNIGKAVLASELIETENIKVLSTGSKIFDELIGGGYPISTLIEIYSSNGVGKTQSCLTATVMATAPESDGGMDADVIYIDTEGTFKAHRVAEIAEARGYDVKSVLDKVHVIRANNSAHQLLLVDEMKNIAKEHKIGLVVVDSVINHLRAEYIGRGTLSERQQLLAKYLSELKSFAEVNKCVLITTNQIMDNPDAMFGPSFKPTGGNVLGHAAGLIIQIRKGKSGKRIMSLMKSPYLPNGECIVMVDKKGVTD